jgi:hypothetical protein
VTHQRVKDGFGFVGGQRSQSWPFMTTSMFNSPIKCSLFTLNVVFLLFFFLIFIMHSSIALRKMLVRPSVDLPQPGMIAVNAPEAPSARRTPRAVARPIEKAPANGRKPERSSR